MKTDLLVNAAIECVERGWVPDGITRAAIRRLCSKRLRSLDGGSAAADLADRRAFVEAALQSPIALVPEKANEQHYEVPAEFYELVLGHRRKYSCCYWPSGVTTLDAAEDAALEESCRHAELEDGMQILELGCGWGSLTLWMAEHYPNCQITAVSNSHSQRTAIERQAAARGYSGRVKVITADMNDFEPDQQFDRVVSIEMFEHMRNYALLLQRISDWLKDDGKLFVHIFCHQKYVYEFSDQNADDWMARHFFTGGIMPSDNWLSHFSEHMKVEQQWRWNGRHYQATAEAWLTNLDQRKDQVLPVLAETYGQEDATRWWMRWRLFFLAVAELFGYQSGDEWYVSHYLMSKATTGERRPADERREMLSPLIDE